MQITVNVSDVDLDTVISTETAYEDGEPVGGRVVTLRDAVVQEIARQALAREKREQWRPLSTAINDVRTELLRELLLPQLTEALTKPITPTDGFGQPKGTQTTLTEIITRQFRELLAERVDKRGNTDTYHRDTTSTRLQWMIRTAVQDVVKDDLAAELAAAREELRETLQATAAAKLAEAVKV